MNRNESLKIIAIVLNDLSEIPIIAKYSRRMSSQCNDWEVFLFDENCSYLGRICHRKTCPSQSVDCCVEKCGQPPHIMAIAGFVYDARIFFSSPIDVLWISSKTSHLLEHRKRLNITNIKKYPVIEDVEIECICCGKSFMFTGREQKWYQKRNLFQPKRCQKCLEQERIEGLREW